LRLSTVGIGIDVGGSVGVVGVTVSVGRGVNVKAGIGVNVSVEGTRVDVFTATVDGEAVGLPLPELQARVIAIRRMRKYMFLIFIF